MSNSDIIDLQKLIEVIKRLRAPDGCPWDREQTHYSLRENLLQETYELIDAIESGSEKNLKEELGDVLLQVVLHSQIADEEKLFSIGDVAKGISDKIIRRHPHVFADTKVKNSAEVMDNWEKIKKQEKPERKSTLSGIVKCQPALMEATQISKKAVKVGFEWAKVEDVWDCLVSEIKEFQEATDNKDLFAMEDEFGDMLFSMINIARWYKIDPELALKRTNKKFIERFNKMEELADKNLSEYNIDELENFWKMAKASLQK